MFYRGTFEALALAALLLVTAGGVQAPAEEKKYPNWKSEWASIVPRMPGQLRRHAADRHHRSVWRPGALGRRNRVPGHVLYRARIQDAWAILHALSGPP